MFDFTGIRKIKRFFTSQMQVLRNIGAVELEMPLIKIIL